MQKLDYISKIISQIDNEKQMKKLLQDILTPQEIELIYERLQIVKDLKKWLSQRQIAEKLNVSTTTVSRWARVLKYGTGILNDLDL